MKLFKQLLIIFSLLLYTINLTAKNNLEKTESFFPDWHEIIQENIDWYFLEVPENLDNPGKNIKIAVIRLKSTENQSSNSTVFIEGGPGGSAIGDLWRWLGHPLRKENDIILLDIRGTGFSQPELCPGLGNSFLEIFARNDSPENDEKSKTELVIKCKDEFIKKRIDLSSYNSKSIAKDLNALKEAFNYDEWNIYGVSYGTHCYDLCQYVP
ncbi:MAG: alpha/beta hydrolase [Clostridiales Family XIII bacterium]|jgi:pimeloyl-ACP methyl ester carboxylesterase|nr:alpha/beta hydrolase [Clostridiales Family XIII bacterium]